MKKDVYDLTNPQKSIYLTEQFYSGTSLGNVCGTLLFEENVDFNLLEKALNIFVERNDATRMRLFVEEGTTKQYVEDYEYFHIDTVDIQSKEDLQKLEDTIVSTPLTLINSPLFKFTMVRFPDGTGGYNACLHHMISDAWSMSLLINEITDLYKKLVNNEEIDLDIKLSYIDYINSETDYKLSEKYIKDKAYWEATFESLPEKATMKPYNITEYALNAIRKPFVLDKDISNKINKFCKEAKTSPYSFFMSIYSIYLSRVSTQDSIVIGTPILNRSNFKDKHTFGMFVSNVPNMIDVNYESNFKDFVSTVTASQMSVFRHQKYPYAELLETLRNKNNTSDGLYDIILSYQNARDTSKESVIKYSTHWLFNGYISESLDVHIYDMDNSELLSIFYDFQTCKFTEKEISDIHNRILTIVNQVLKTPNILLKDIEIVPEAEKEELLYKFNNTDADFPTQTIVELFESQVKSTPNNVAVAFKDTYLTYQELNEKSNQLARLLRNLGITNNSPVGIRIHKSLEMIIAILGIMKAGGCYLPIDLSYPDERVNFMLQDSSTKILLTTEEDSNNLKIHKNIKKIDISLSNDSIYSLDTSNLENINHPKDLIYIIYTSGSTGIPKGVMLTHHNVVRLMKNSKFQFSFSEKDVWTMFHSVAFDFSVWETYGALLYGGKLVVVPEIIAKDPGEFLKLLRKEHVTVLNQTPTYFYNLLDYESRVEDSGLKIRYIVFGGEALKPNLTKPWKDKYPTTKLVNMYGITETTVHVTFKELTNIELDSSRSNIGIPIPTLKVYLLDKNLKLVPKGSAGEICVAGDGVCNGYLNRPELNATKFVDNPYIPNEKIYRSGDSAFLTEQNELIYLQRIDSQVKIRGFRVELGEIEKRISEYPNILNCVVDKKDVDGHEFLCAYYTKKEEIDLTKLKEYLLKDMPHYMIPHYFILLSSIPHNSNGKVDKKRLPPPEISASTRSKKLPRNNLDSKLLLIFEELLKNKDIGIEDSILDLGGDSLTIINMCTRIYTDLSLQINVQEFLELQTIEKISDFLKEKKTITKKQINKAEKNDLYPITEQQKGIYLASQKAGQDSCIYNVPINLCFDGKIDTDKFKKVIKTIIKRHEAYRTSFILEENSIMQKISDMVNIDIDILKIKEEEIENYKLNFVKPFDLGKAPLLRVQILESENKTFILIDMHHIISDGKSLEVLVKEIETIYNNQMLPELELQYKDYAVWQNENNASGKKIEYEPLDITYDYTKKEMETYNGNTIFDFINLETSDTIHELSKSLNVTPYMLFLAVYFILLSRYSSSETITVASASEGRQQVGLEHIIGMFVKDLIIKNNVDSTKSFKQFLNTLKKIVTKEIENSEKYTDSYSTSKIFDTMFLYIHNIGEKIKLGNVSGTGNAILSNTSKFDFSIQITQNIDTFKLDFEYSTNLFKKETAQHMLKHYQNILLQIIKNPNIKINDIEIITPEEKNTLLSEFNNTKTEYKKEIALHMLIEKQAKETPNRIALLFEDSHLTYKELNEYSNSLAHHLRERGVKPNTIVGVMVNRSFEMLIGILAILKAGGAYVPIDPEYPEDRIRYMIENSNSLFVLSQKALSNILVDNSKTIFIDLEEPIYQNNKHEIENISTPRDMIYLIYTSGSTGKPKGVMMTHQAISNFTNYCNNTLEYLKQKELRTMASVSTVSFDIFVLETLISLQKGLQVVIANKEEQLIPKELNKLLEKHKVHAIQMTPSRMRILLDNLIDIPNLKNLTSIVLAGEAFSDSLAKDLRKVTSARLYNGYGPSETTYVTLVDVTDMKHITIGKPMYNTQIYIMKNLKLCPVGVPGEIYISGDNVGLGYIHNEDLTNKSFINNPYTNEVMYATGDIGYYNIEGEIVCLGRIDHQVKIRGLRIELEEIENKILEFPNILNCVVDKRTENYRDTLCAYYTKNGAILVSELKQFLSNYLPAYMIPQYFLELNEFPYTPNGKIDRKNLKDIELVKAVRKQDDITKLTKEELKFTEIWKNLLKIDYVSIDDDFFEIGGDSILAITLQINAMRAGINIKYEDIFKYKTIRNMLNKDRDNFSLEIDNYDYSDINQLISRNSIDNIPEKIEKQQIGNILLTGATGFLGAHILDKYLQEEKGKVYCLIRGENVAACKKRLTSILTFYFEDKYTNEIDNRIQVLNGDIINKKLKLDTSTLQLLSDEITTVVHSASLVKHYGNENKFYNININGVKNIIDFCIANNKKLVYISTIGVSGLAKNNDITFSERDLYIGQQIGNIYVYSKFIAERLVLENILNGLDALIIRPGNILNRYTDFKFQKNFDENRFVSVLKSFIDLKKIPDNLINNDIEISPVDYLSSSIVRLLQYPSKANIFNLINTNKIPLCKIVEMLKTLNINIQFINLTNFEELIHKMIQKNENNSVLSGLINNIGNKIQFDFDSTTSIDANFTEQYMKNIGFIWPSIDEHYIKKIMKYFNDIKYFNY